MAESTFDVNQLASNLSVVDKASLVANNILESRMVGVVNAYKGIPIQLVYPITTGAATGLKIFDANAPYKFEVIDVSIQPRGASTNGTMKLTNGTSDITNAMVCAVDKTMVKAGTIDDAYSTIEAGGTLEVVCAGDAVASTIGLVVVTIVKK